MRICDNGVYRDMTPEEEAEYLAMQPEPIVMSYEERVVARIRLKYSVDDELALLRQRDSKPEEYQEYYDYVEQIKEEEKASETESTEGSAEA